MATTTEDVRVEAQRVWPNAKLIDVHPGGFAQHSSFTSPDPAGWRVAAMDYDDRLIDQVSAATLEDVKAKLENMQPTGGQAP